MDGCENGEVDGRWMVELVNGECGGVHYYVENFFRYVCFCNISL